MASLDAFKQVRSAFEPVEIPREKAGLSFVLHTVELANGTREQVTKLIAWKEKKPLGRFAELLLSGKLWPRTQHVFFHILFHHEPFREKLRNTEKLADLMEAFEKQENRDRIEHDIMIYFSLFDGEGAIHVTLEEALGAIIWISSDV